MAVALDAEFGGGGFLFRERNVHDRGAAIPQTLDDLVIGEPRSLEIADCLDIRDESSRRRISPSPGSPRRARS